MSKQTSLEGNDLAFQSMCYGWGAIPAKFMFVGISAGRLGALITSVPFTKDASGRLLQRCLFQLGLSESGEHSTAPEYVDCYVTNFVKGQCLTDEGLNRPPTEAEFRFWWPTLANEIKRVQPKMIIALGKVVYDWLVGYLFQETDKVVVKVVKHPRWYQSHGALSNSQSFRNMLDDYRKILFGGA